MGHELDVVELKVLAVDIGTNSTLHLLADITDGRLNVIESGIVGNGLGAKIGSDGRIGSELMDENRQILVRLAQLAKDNDCVQWKGVGTHALRQAVNSSEFLDMANRVGFPVEIISDETEALLAWQGVFGSANTNDQCALLDIGGGSSELSIGIGKSPTWTDSVAMGAVSLGRRYFADDPPSKSQIISAKKAIHTAFDHWNGRLSRDIMLTGIAGTVVMLAMLEHDIAEYQAGCVEGLQLNMDQVLRWSDKLLTCDLSARREICRLSPARAESIHAGSLILSELMKRYGWSTLIVSEKGVLYGLVSQLGNCKNN